MMKKNTILLSLLLVMIGNFLHAQKNVKNILKSTNIKEIEEYLSTTFPEDPKKSVLKPKLIALKNEAWTKGKKNAKPMEARPVLTEIPNSVMKDANSKDAEEFKRLITETSKDHKEKTAQLLTAMFSEDISSKEAILFFTNNSNCNLVLKIQGKDFYNMAIPAHGENFIVINKGSYTLNSNICDVKYSSQKDIRKNILLHISNPTVLTKE